MKKTVSIALAALMLCALAFSFAACANKQGGTPEDVSPKGKVETMGNISVYVPDGWRLQASSGEGPDSCFVMKGSAMSDGYVWITIADRSLADSSIAGNNTAEIEPFTVNGTEWSGKDGCFCGTIGDKLYLITLYALSHDDADVQSVIGSLADR